MNTHVRVSNLNFKVAARQIELLTGDTDTPMHWRLLDDKKRAGRKPIELFATLKEARSRIEAAQADSYGIFCVPNEGGGADKEISRVRALYIDMDGGSPLGAMEWHIEPEFVVRRDETHFHAYWIVSDCPVSRFREMQQRLIAYYGSDRNVCNPSRLMRLAGTIHHKGDPVFVNLIEMNSGEAIGEDFWI